MCKLHYFQFKFQKYLTNVFFIAYENNKWCHFVVHIGSPALALFCCMSFGSFCFSLIFLVFLWVLLLAEVLKQVWKYLKQSSGVVLRFLSVVWRGELLPPYLVINEFRLGKIRGNLTSTCLLELLAAEYLRETYISFFLYLIYGYVDALKESSKKKETRIKKEIVDVLQQATYRRKRSGWWDSWHCSCIFWPE